MILSCLFLSNIVFKKALYYILKIDECLDISKGNNDSKLILKNVYSKRTIILLNKMCGLNNPSERIMREREKGLKKIASFFFLILMSKFNAIEIVKRLRSFYRRIVF